MIVFPQMMPSAGSLIVAYLFESRCISQFDGLLGKGWWCLNKYWVDLASTSSPAHLNIKDD
jgi:hypothetical protein